MKNLLLVVLFLAILVGFGFLLYFSKTMKKLVIIGGVVLVVVILGFWLVGRYNSLVILSEQTNSAWAQVENDYQRRSDLIPNLVNTVKGVANFEKDTLTNVIEARAKATSVRIDPKGYTEQQLREYERAQSSFTSAIGRLLVVSEQYPVLQATKNFSDLQAQLEGTENRITVSRGRFNEVVQTYNAVVKSFPTNIIAGFTSFQAKAYFQSQAGSDVAPVVDFGNKPAQQ